VSETNFERLVTVGLSDPDFTKKLKTIIERIRANDATAQQDLRETLKTVSGDWLESEVTMIIEAVQSIDLEPIFRAATVFGDDSSGN
jgi:hypothetical protein